MHEISYPRSCQVAKGQLEDAKPEKWTSEDTWKFYDIHAHV